MSQILAAQNGIFAPNFAGFGAILQNRAVNQTYTQGIVAVAANIAKRVNPVLLGFVAISPTGLFKGIDERF